MNEEEWSRFLITKTKHNRQNYSMRRVCLDCGKAILNVNLSGFCSHCAQKHKYDANHRNNGKRGEGLEHQELKRIAQEFLSALGCQNITTEYRIKTAQGHQHKVVIDAIGFLGSRIIGVECGGSLRSKLLKAIPYLDRLYILPYGKQKPYLWHINTLVCHQCGQKIDH